MSVVIQLYNQNTLAFLGYLKAFDADIGTDTVTGEAHATWDAVDAMKFPDMTAAMEFATQQSKRVPFRPDGKPNRPLMAFTMEFKVVPDND